eukprot:jgi/Botrbrau1/9304/Bobra.0111s0028.1
MLIPQKLSALMQYCRLSKLVHGDCETAHASPVPGAGQSGHRCTARWLLRPSCLAAAHKWPGICSAYASLRRRDQAWSFFWRMLDLMERVRLRYILISHDHLDIVDNVFCMQ